MDKNAIKKYAVWARRELIKRVSQRAEKYDITAEADANAFSVNGVLLSDAEKKQRKALIDQVKRKGFDQVMEEVAYTWFNRFIALRFMEVNGYLPSHIRVFTDDNNIFKPQILAEAIHLELEGLDIEKVYEMKNNNENDELYKYLIIIQCNELSRILPRMFQKISDYTELLFPDNILRVGSVIEQMISIIPEVDWKDQIQVVGWLYQYYNSEPKDKVFAELKKNKKITKEKIPAATQLFTPDWIVRYMVENSLGRLWVEGKTNKDICSNWKYYLDEANQDENVRNELEGLYSEHKNLKPEEIMCIDPCSGSGHILAYMFDILVQIYEDYGVSTRDAVKSIIQNNIWGLDIDERASQLAYFSIMMKAVQYDRRFLSRRDSEGEVAVPQPHIFSICESNDLDREAVEYFCNGNSSIIKDMDTLIKDLNDAKEYGSILNVSSVNFDALFKRFDECKDEINMYSLIIEQKLYPFVQVAQTLAQKYHVVVTNPPYMGSSGMDEKLTAFVKSEYPDSKSDLFAVFIERCLNFSKAGFYQAMITQHAWMFLSSYEKLREKMKLYDVINMTHLGARAFDEIGGEVVQTTSFVLRKKHIPMFRGVYCRLVDPTSEKQKEELFLSGNSRYIAVQDKFALVSGNPIAYWASDQLFNVFEYPMLANVVPTKKGLDTGQNDLYLRLWYEVDFSKVGIGFESSEQFSKAEKKWAPHDKGGNFRRWYGNKDWVINWENNGYELHHSKANLRSEKYYFSLALTWSSLSSGKINFRLSDYGAISNTAGSSLYPNYDDAYYYLGLLNSVSAQYVLDFISPTLNYSAGPVGKIPIIMSEQYKKEIESIVKENVEIARQNWNNSEISWDFKKHPLVQKASGSCKLQDIYGEWEEDCLIRFNKLKNNEERLNELFIDIYGLQGELKKDVDPKDVSIELADAQRDIKSLLSYAVGCMMGRYSLDYDGIACAGLDWDTTKYCSYIPDKDAIIPISDDEYFSDDIVERTVEFIKVVFGNEFLEENLKFIAEKINAKGKGSARDIIRDYYINDFYTDHIKLYQKRPIYWMFDSGKENGFKCLVYLHRYKSDTIARIRTDYVHEQQSRYRTAISDIEKTINSVSTNEKVTLSRKLSKLQNQIEELRSFEEKVHHYADQMIEIDLDNGVKSNYGLLKELLFHI